jgi:hypothetical protein
MQGRIKGLVVFLVLLALAGWILALRGCHQTVVMDVTDKDAGSVGETPEAHPAIKKGMALVWTYGEPFSIKFDDNNPCVLPPDGSSTYQAEQNPDTKQYTVTCNVNGTPPRKRFKYHIIFTSPSHMAPTGTPPPDQFSQPPPPSSGHCYGCSADGD